MEVNYKEMPAKATQMQNLGRSLNGELSAAWTSVNDLRSTWYGVTPEEHEMGALDVSIVDTGIAVTTTVKADPGQRLIKASEIILPSFERMYDTYMIKVAANVTY